MTSKRENTPLLSTLDLDSTKFYTTNVTLKTVTSITGRYYLMVPCILVHFFSYVFYNLVTTQYLYDFFARKLIANVTATEINLDGSPCTIVVDSLLYHQRTLIQKDTTKASLTFVIVGCVPALFMDVIIGVLSDRYGRKLFVIISLVGTLVKIIMTMVGMHYKVDVHYFLVFIAVEGFAGGWCAVISLGFAYVSDVTSVGKTRTSSIALIEISIGLGLVMAGVPSGYLIDGVGFVYAMMVLMLLNVINILIMLFCLPDTVNETNCVKGSSLRLFKSSFTFYTRDTSATAKRWKYITCIAIFIFFNFSALSRQTIEQLYQLNAPFCWNAVKIGWYSSLSDLLRNVVGLAAIRGLQNYISDELMVVVSAVSGCFAYLLEAFAVNDAMLFTVPLVGVFSMVTDPILRSIMSRMTPSDRQGALFAGLAMVQTSCTILVDVMTKSVYLATVDIARGSVFFLSAGCCVFVLILFVIFALVSRKSGKQMTLNE
ncbi:lysosomal proton-coupled steroid conjugate and bile acid symporter SLC46A3-like [Ylistrum balloti]|uniref:lysosomal proton-coupled steroid conjugate and bile acid symporter SLC46A3-like n=1 Tax=Ylistrum balloti TaxID=509963 RepID=UPI002905D849|nr:lysosomal proton-coupled steroid conjugate and bile acid symporter SLC46A3-like [Ylistrum balloti]